MPEAARHIGLLLHDFRLGGSERIAIRLAREWAARGRCVSLFVGEDSGPMRALVGSGLAIHEFVQDYQRSKWHTRRLARWAAGAALAAGVDTMFLPGNSYFRAIPELSRQLPVFSKLSNPIVRADKTALRNLVFRLVTARRWRGLAGLVVCSQGQAQEVRQQVWLQAPMTVIANPILDVLPQPTAVARVPGQLCAVGRLELQKNYPLMLRAFALLRDLPLTLRIAGDGNLNAPLRRLAQQLGIASRVEFLGTVGDARPLLAESEALLLTSDYEGTSAVCVEALAAGTPVIARDAGAGVRDILRTPRTSSIVTEATPEAFAGAVRRFLQQRDFDAAAARAVAAEHVIGPIADRYLQLLDAGVAARG